MIRRVFTRRLSLLSLAVVIGATAAIFAGTAQASLLWYDGFSLTGDGGDYVVDTTITGQTGGSGSFFAGPWENASEQVVIGTSLDRALITPAVGGSVSTGVWDGSRVGRAFASPWGGFTAPEGTYYMGFLVNYGGLADPTTASGGPQHRVVEMYDSTLTDDAYRTLQLGYSPWSGLGDGLHLTMQVNGVNAQLAENVNWVQDRGTTHYVVLKFEMNATDDDELTTADNDIVSVYLDPVGTTEPATPSAQVSTADFLASYLTTVTKYDWTGATPPGFDELRVADAFADVANNTEPYVEQPPLPEPPAVPEPATMVLFGLGLLGLVNVARRR